MAELSVIIPIYNAEEYLHECIDSTLCQTMSDIEIILVDDGATDSSPDICDEYARKDSRVRVVHKPNGGVCDARNAGIREVKTPYFTFLESDDWLPEDACEKMFRYVENNGAEFVIGSYYKVSTSGTTVKHPLPEKEIFFDENTVKSELLEYVMGLTGARLKTPGNVDSLLTDTAKLYKTSIVKDNDIYWISRKEIYSDCLEYILRYASYCKSAVFFDEPVYYYRRTNTGSQTAGYRADTIKLWDVQFDSMRDFITGNGFEHLWTAFYSRVCFSIIPIGGNAYRSGSRKEAMRQIRQFLKNPIYKEAFANFRINDLPVHFRPLFFFAKHKMYYSFYVMTVVMRKIMNSQRGM
ncbi:MAG: glycosyltransferase family 2 protein [Ruminococcaceae bacterium]|nr:glycosyltransferase family 2 protein [Oscillospiraceae bacterium]